MITIRRATGADAAALAELAEATFWLATPAHTTAEAVADFLREMLAESNFAGYLADPERLLLVAEEDGILQGYTMLVFGEPTDADARAAIGILPTAELSKFYLRQETHGRGVAAPLMTATLNEARARGASGSWLGVNQENGRAIRFYEKNGYAKVGVKRFLVGGQYEDDFVLERAL
ncbi:GNAT family N-acetyltransferase [Cryobacterium sp. PH31-AA6]|uniref:GNAT family N-acetyltransferase n=1 Tax=Cryobacterium sp. PH31-AA6 TaxID=3046205 RepID=UPI0024B93B5B|nr:GNAT family N-acetyltransferase [Cryobacterium sp. PH31-AA6]MDJ0323423.1 GNAT family N-acetyltransferase [Cryobacterium sp. PH31-AA6]